MIYSMTGYGRCEVEENHRKITVEMSSINHRYLDINIRMPRTLAHFEDVIRKTIKQKVSRGKLDVNVYYSSMSKEDFEVIVNENICRAYMDGFAKISETFKIENDIKLSDFMQVNDLLVIQKKQADQDEVFSILQKAIDTSLSELLKMRSREGQTLKTDILEKSKSLYTMVDVIFKRSFLVVEEYKKKLEIRIAALLEDIQIDPSRIAAEAALFADKCSIDEELTRLKSHLSQLIIILEEDGVVGRKLDFLMQEINREANTIGAKANDYEITQNVVNFKTEIEKIREQVQNIE